MSETVKPLPANSVARYGCYVALGAALCLLSYAAWLLLSTSAEAPIPFKIAVLIAGGLELYLAIQALAGKRSAWSFLLSLNGTLAIAFLFGAARVRDAVSANLIIGLLPAAAFSVITTLLALGSDDY